MRLEINPYHPEPRKIAQAVKVLRRGAIVAYPTDTIYALGVTLGDKKAVDRLYQTTGKPRTQPLTFVCPDLSDIARYAVIENPSYRIMKRLMPGPFCFVLPATREVPRMFTQKRKTVGIRVPDHPIALALARELGVPLVSTSATHRGEEALNDPADIVARFKDVALVLDAGYGGLVPSTMVDLTGAEPEILREGAGDVDAVG